MHTTKQLWRASICVIFSHWKGNSVVAVWLPQETQLAFVVVAVVTKLGCCRCSCNRNLWALQQSKLILPIVCRRHRRCARKGAIEKGTVVFHILFSFSRDAHYIGFMAKESLVYLWICVYGKHISSNSSSFLLSSSQNSGMEGNGGVIVEE